MVQKAKLTSARNRLDNSQRIAGIGDWEYDFPNRRLLWSEEIYQILGVARKDFPPDSETFYRQVHPDELARVHREKRPPRVCGGLTSNTASSVRAAKSATSTKSPG